MMRLNLQDAIMLRALRLQNYKCFEDQSLDLKALTLLSGLNGVGKSSVLQALLLCAWRLYFYPLEEKRKLIIGYIGPHLRTVRFSH